MFSKLLIANRGEIACRIIRSARRLGIATVALYSEADADTPHTRLADEAIAIGAAAASQSYLNAERILEAAAHAKADAIHPGYGFLSENAAFAQAVADAGIAFVGPSPQAIAAMGDKIESREHARRAGVNIIPGLAVADAAAARAHAREIGYPVMIKAAAGGGGKGMRIVTEESALESNFTACVQEAESSFGDGRVLLERYISAPRHIEIQLLADQHGNCLHLAERECSLQRRNQKIIEEAPSPFVTEDMRAQMSAQAIALAKAVGYHSAGTVEFVADGERNFHFLEMNTRLQVEHPVSELITGLDLVEWMIRIAAGERLPFTQDAIRLSGWALESRIYAEDPHRDFLPSPGRLIRYRPPPPRSDGDVIVRNDAGVEEGGRISPYYDPMIAKLCVWAQTREDAITAMSEALDGFEIDGIAHNIPLLGALMENERFRSGALTTHFLAEEYPGGFKPLQPQGERLLQLAAIAAHMEYVQRHRGAGDKPLSLAIEIDDWRAAAVCRQGGKSGKGDKHGAGFASIITLNGTLNGDEEEREMRLESDWRPGLHLFQGSVDGVALALSVAREKEGFTLSWRGIRARVILRSPRAAQLMALLPERAAAAGGASRHLLCPMPGVVVALHVREGDEVRAGDALAVVEAMKMQNILHAENAGKVARVACIAGQQLGVGEVMIEFA